MRKLGWVTIPLLICGLASCAGQGAVSVDYTPAPEVHSGEGSLEPQFHEQLFNASSFKVSSMNGQGEFRIQTEYANGKQLVSVVADAPITTPALLLEITYNADACSPQVVQLAQKLLALPDALVLESLQTAGKVDVAFVPTDGQNIEFGFGETVAQIMFEPASSGAATQLRSASAVPASANAVAPLIWDEANGELRWYMVNPGDYDQNGEVNISDLWPLAVHFGETGPFEYQQAQSVIDGNGDGEISIQDITPIAQNIYNRMEGYNLFASDNVLDIPIGYAEPSTIEPIATFMLAAATNADDTASERLYFSYTPDVEQLELMFWARPFETDATGDVSEGSRSNINSPQNKQNPDPDGPDFNFAPVASLSMELLGTHTPLEVLLDGSASYDPDGYIEFYEWDYEGDGLFDAYSAEPVIAYTYNNPGTYAPTLKVTDNHGSSDSFASPPFTVDRDEVSNIVPFADLYATEYSGLAPLTVGLIATGCSDVDGYIAKYEWDFDGDGAVDLDSGMDPTVMHTYDEDGVYACRVIATDNAGASAFAEVEIEVVDPDANWAPQPEIIANPAFGEEGVRVTLDASGSSDVDGEIVLYEYDFDGDGLYDSYGSLDTASHTYNNAGVFKVTLRVTDDGGEYNISNTTVYVSEPVDLSIPWQSMGGDSRNTNSSTYVGAQTNNIMWTTSPEMHCGEDLVIGSDGTIYTTGYTYVDGSLVYAFNPDGTLKWSFNDIGTFASLAIGNDGTVYSVGSFKLYAFNPDGTEKWSIPPPGSVGQLEIGLDGTIFYSSLGDIYAINSDGTEKWVLATDNASYGTPFVGAGGTLFVIGRVGDNYLLYVVNPDGTIRWSNHMEPGIGSLRAIGTDGTAYFTNYSSYRRLSAINLDGSLKWSIMTSSYPQHLAIGADGTIFLTLSSGLLALNPDGTEKWQSTIGRSYHAPAVGADGAIYTGGYESVYAINSDGTEKWSYQLLDSLDFRSPAIGLDGTVYTVSSHGRIYAFGVGNSPIAALSANPTFGHIPINVDFDANGSIDPDGTIVNYEWDFEGDGVFDSSGSSNTVSHTYTEGEVFNAQVRVTDNEGLRGTANVEVMILGPGVWGHQAVDSDGRVGSYSSLTVVNGNPAVSYYDVTNESLKYVRATDPGGVNWGTPQQVDISGEVGKWTSLTLVNGKPAISYYDSTNGNVNFVRSTDANGSFWGTPVAVLTNGNYGIPSLCVVDGNPAISSSTYPDDDLIFVRATDADGSSWGTPLIIDSSGRVGWYSSLAIVESIPAISYYDYTNGDLKYVRATTVDGSSWGSPQTIDSIGLVGSYTTLAVVNGNPAISYFDDTNNELKYVRAADTSGSEWGTPQAIDHAYYSSFSTSLVVVDGNPAISYMDYSYDLLYVRATDVDGSSWGTPLELDYVGTVGQFTSLAVVDDSPAISYYDVTNGHLKFARLY